MSTHQPMTELQPDSCKAHTTAMAFPGFPFRVSTWTSSDLTLRNEGMPTSLGHHLLIQSELTHLLKYLQEACWGCGSKKSTGSVGCHRASM